ncbi:MAG: nicotinate-nucleotide adenylyltransferase [Methylococcaceae bacterium]|nr:nicotinate-nucleotide adenylyltransferase [Methylococcaceae bacterium]
MIGIFGGTFDPVHYGHLRSALEVKDIFDLTELRLIPSARPPHRQQPEATTSARVHMLEQAIENQPGFICDTRELDREGHSYMIDTLKSLRQDFPKQPLLLFIGCDAFNNLSNWYQWQHLFDYAHIVVMTRPGFEIQHPDAFFTARQILQREALTQSAAGKLFFQPVTQLDISATVIRHMIAEKKSPAYLLPDVVLSYIYQHHLYEKH